MPGVICMLADKSIAFDLKTLISLLMTQAYMLGADVQ